MAIGLNSASSATAEDILTALLTHASYTGPTTVAIQLHTGGAGPAGTNHVATENSRKAVTFTIASGAASNSNAPTWSAVAATEQYTFASFWDNTTAGAGTFLFSASMTADPVTAGQAFSIPIGDITIQFNNAS